MKVEKTEIATKLKKLKKKRYRVFFTKTEC